MSALRKTPKLSKLARATIGVNLASHLDKPAVNGMYREDVTEWIDGHDPWALSNIGGLPKSPAVDASTPGA